MYATGTGHKYRYPESGRTGDGKSVSIEYPIREVDDDAIIRQTKIHI